MADKSLILRQGNDSLRPVTNAKCVKMQGVGSLHNAHSGAVQVPHGILADGSITSASRYSSSKFTGMKTSVVMKEAFLAPHAAAEFLVNIDPQLAGLKVKIFYGYNEGMSSTTSNVSKYQSGDLANGDSFAFPIDIYNVASGYDKARCYYRLVFVSSEMTLSATDIADAIRLGYLAVTYVEQCGNVVARNHRATEIIEVSKGRKTIGTSGPRHRNFIFTHISDMHANAIALANALKYSKAVNSQALFVTGDVVAQSSYDGYEYVHELCKGYTLPSLLTSGNHDGVGVSSLGTFNAAFFGNMSTTFGYVRSSITVGYYYKDLDGPKIRVIALDCSDTSASYRINSIGTTQITWLQNTLASTPSGYGVIILLHQPLGNPSAASRSGNPSFAAYPDLASADINWTGAAGVRTAVDEFISRGGEFIMYCNGHQHADIVGILANTSQRQLQCCVASPNGMYDMQNDICSVGDGVGNAQDLFNAYIIDRTLHTVRVVRIGANICEDLSERLIEEFSYV